jgi:hypothetical protein
MPDEQGKSETERLLARATSQHRKVELLQLPRIACRDFIARRQSPIISE